jgi:hypothetical protein
MPNTFTLIASYTVGAGGAASIDFTSIPSTYTDLQILVSARTSNAAITDDFYLKFNNDTTNSYSFRTLLGTGATAASQNGSNTFGQYIGVLDGANATASTFVNASIYVPNYAGSTLKSTSVDIVSENNATTAYATLVANLWNSTAAINRVTLFAGYANFAQHSTAYLYGVKNA